MISIAQMLHRLFIARVALAATWLLAMTCTEASAQIPQLFEPLAATAAADINPQQAQALSRIRARPTTGSVTLMRVNAAALTSRDISVKLAADTQIPVRYDQSEIVGRMLVWKGAVPNVPGQATFVVEDGNITGTVDNNGQIYRVEPIGSGVHAVIKLDSSRLPPDHPPSFADKERIAPSSAPTPSSSPRKKLGGASSRLGDTRAPSTAPTVIDVLVAYTRDASGAVANINSLIALAVAEANQSYVNSQIGIRLSLVNTMQVEYSEDGKTFETILGDLVSDPGIKMRRDIDSADLVAMIINKSDFCGLADAIRATSDTAYAVIYFDCATGYYSFAHELGHLMGARHDMANDPSKSPFSYGHGYQYLSGATKWRTIMAYDCAGGCVRLQYWSNPLVRHGGVPMGTIASNNNARVLNETASEVASFRSAPLALNAVQGMQTGSVGSTDAVYARSDRSSGGHRTTCVARIPRVAWRQRFIPHEPTAGAPFNSSIN